ncbi:MAG: CubicO group peptidase (beta-lactamase class C family), partial [Gammaproteobacteria bacterium]
MPDLSKQFADAGSATIPHEEWDRFPWNRWTFQNVRQMVATTEVWRGNGVVWELPEHPINFDEIQFQSSSTESLTVSQWLTQGYNDGIIVLHNGTIVYERYRNAMSNRSLHLSQSMAKSVTACVAGILIERGLLDPDKKITDYLPELAATAYNGATLRQVLDMSSGVHYVEDYEAPDSHIAAMDIAAGWKWPRQGFEAPESMWEHILSLKESTRTHGECFNYRSIETEVVAHCMERVTNKGLAELISEELWQP